MKSMKKYVVRTFVLLLVLVCALGLVACGEDEHTHSYTENVVAPTCTEKGYTEYTCDCGDTYTADEKSAAHSMTSVVEKAPTCTEAGYAAHSECSVCGYVDGEAQTLEALGHNYTITYDYPTTTADGARKYNCQRCGDTKSETIDAISISLPGVSDVVAEIIGNASYKLELEEDSRLVYVTELSDYSDRLGIKGFIYFDLAEAVISGKDDTLNAHLKVKVGTTEAELDGLVPAKEVTASGALEVAEIYVYVNGDNVSVEMIDANGQSQEFTENLSDAFYEALAELVGMDKERMLQLIYVMTEFERFAPIVENLAETVVNGLPTVSDEYINHLADLFELVGDEFVKKSVDDNGNTVYEINVEALNLFLAEIEDKTVADYLESVYGEDVMKVVSDFLEALPSKTVKEVAENAIAFVEESGIEIEDFYTVIDLYVYFATNVEFSLENEIFSRYDMTFAEILAVNAGIPDSSKTEYINAINASFEQAAASLNLITVEDLIGMALGADAQFIDGIREMINTADENVTLKVTVNSNGDLVNAIVTLATHTLVYELDGSNVVLTIISDGIEAVIRTTENGFEFTMKEDGAVVATGTLTSTALNATDTQIVVDMRVGGRDLLDCTVIVSSGNIISIDAVIREYVDSEGGEPSVYETSFDYLNDLQGNMSLQISSDSFDYIVYTYNGEDGSIAAFEYSVGGQLVLCGSAVITETVDVDNVTTEITLDIHSGDEDLLDGEIILQNDVISGINIVFYEYEEVWDDTAEDYVSTSSVAFGFIYMDAGVEGKNIVIGNSERQIELSIVNEPDYFRVAIVMIDGEAVEGEDVVMGAIIESASEGFGVLVVDENNVLLRFVVNLTELGNVESGELVINGYDYVWNVETETEEKVFVENLFNAGFNTCETADGADGVRIEIQGTVFIVGYKKTENGFFISVTDEDEDNVFATLEVADETVKLFVGTNQLAVIDAAVSVSESYTNGITEYLIDIDLNQLLLLIESYYSGEDDYTEFNYIEFDGAIKITVS